METNNVYIINKQTNILKKEKVPVVMDDTLDLMSMGSYLVLPLPPVSQGWSWSYFSY